MTTAEELAQLIEKTVKAVIEGLHGNPLGESKGGNKRILEAKGMSRVDTFTGKDAQWREWAFQFNVAVKAMNTSVAEILSKVEVEEDGHKLEDLELEFANLEVERARGVVRPAVPLPQRRPTCISARGHIHEWIRGMGEIV